MVSGCRLPSRLASRAEAPRGADGPARSGQGSRLPPFERVSIRLTLLLSLAGGSDCHGPATPQEVVTDPTKRVPTACRKELVTARWKEVVTGRRKDSLPHQVKFIVPSTPSATLKTAATYSSTDERITSVFHPTRASAHSACGSCRKSRILPAVLIASSVPYVAAVRMATATVGGKPRAACVRLLWRQPAALMRSASVTCGLR